MLSNQSYKTQFTLHAHTSAGTAASSSIDTAGYRNLKILCWFSTTDVTSTFAIEQSDTTNAADFGAISGFVNATDYTHSTSTATGFRSPSAMFAIDMRGRKRYLRIKTGGATAQDCWVVVESHTPTDVPYTAIGMGAKSAAAACIG